jgi:hypothetical protein
LWRLPLRVNYFSASGFRNKLSVLHLVHWIKRWYSFESSSANFLLQDLPRSVPYFMVPTHLKFSMKKAS